MTTHPLTAHNPAGGAPSKTRVRPLRKKDSVRRRLPLALSPSPLLRGSAALCLLVCLLIPLAAPSNAAPQTLIETDFGAARQPVADADPAHGKVIKGVVPEGWYDNSNWNSSIHARYQTLKEGGIRFWRVVNGPEGRAQIAHPLPDVTQRGYYDLTVTARGHSESLIECGIRLVGDPYTNVGPYQLDLTPQWKTYHLRVPVDAQRQSVGFWFNFESGTRMDITTFRLQLLNRDDLIAEIKARWPGGGRGNLARETRFPLGMPVGWTVPTGEAMGVAVTIATAPSMIGPSGTPALRISAPHGAAVDSAPFFIPWTFAPHVLSLSIRGSGTAQITVRGDGRGLSSRAFTLGNRWQRAVVPFTPLFEGKSHDFEIDVNGTAWIDALQVERGSAPTPYTPSTPAEVALACPPSDASLVHVQFSDEPDRLEYAVAGAAAGDRLRVSITDIYGETRALPVVVVPRSGRGVIRYAVFPNHPYGPFRVDAWVTDPKGRRRSGEGEIVVSRLRRPRFWGKDAPNSPFGVHINPSPQQALLAKAIGANWVRTHDCGLQITGWSFVEPSRGQWQFDDRELAYYRRQHLEVLGMLSTAPGWATSVGRPATGYWDRYAEPKSMADWAEYVRRTVGHYKGTIHAYEIWNEPWGDYWGVWDNKLGHSVKTPDSFAHFALLQKTAYQAAKSVDPKITILGFNTTGGDQGRAVPGSSWTRALLENGGLSSCDVISYHHYSSSISGSRDDAVAHARAEALGPILTEDHGVPKPVWLSEGNAVNHMLDVGFYKAIVPGTPPDKNWDAANRLSRFVVSLLAHGDQKVFLYTMHADSQLGAGPADWRTLVTSDGTLHPCGDAYAALTWQLEGLKPVGMKSPAKGVTAFSFAGAGRRVTVYAASPNATPFHVPPKPGATVADLFGNPLPAGAVLGSTIIFVSSKG
ncbi:MAG TPA: hypothetical protein VFJ58_26110 [Armatimonadota bacterium]|nr:hypothetical protein [Armatimonadota bacterium]